MLKLKKGRYYDENGNHWGAKSHTLETATAKSQSLTNCYGCVNCHNCINCIDCVNCSHCVGCCDCRQCHLCRSCLEEEGLVEHANNEPISFLRLRGFIRKTLTRLLKC